MTDLSRTTKLVTTGRPKGKSAHLVNTPPSRGSTVLFPTYEEFKSKTKKMIYGRFGTQVHYDFIDSLNALQRAQHTTLAPSGLAAITVAVTALCQAGDHILITDNVYDPVRAFADEELNRLGIEVEYFAPRCSEAIAHLIKPTTRLILAEIPGSLTFEISDIPALAKTASAAGVLLLVDNTWASGYFCDPFTLGADICIMSATKYISGHSDCLLGTISTKNVALGHKIEKSARNWGMNVAPDDVYLAHRGLRSLPARLKVHEENGLGLAKWLERHEKVRTVYHPGLSSHPDNSLWKRDFSGSTGLFGVELRKISENQLTKFCNSLELFGMGYSWGGY